jgi:hypothetical protein
MRFSHLVFAIALAVSTSCGGATEPKPVDLTGRWEGDLRGIALTMNVRQHGTQLIGEGTLGADEPFTVTGTFNDPVVSLTVNPAPYTGFTLTGEQHDGTSISGVANGYLLNNVALVLIRQ